MDSKDGLYGGLDSGGIPSGVDRGRISNCGRERLRCRRKIMKYLEAVEYVVAYVWVNQQDTF